MHLLAPVAAGPRRQGNADGVADAFLEERAHGCGAPYQSFQAHAGLGQPEMDGLSAALCQLAADGDEVLGLAAFARQHDARLGQAGLEGAFRRLQGGGGHAPVEHRLRRQRLRRGGVVGEHALQQFLVQGAGVHADAHRLVQVPGHRANLGEARVVCVAFAHVAGVDAVFVQRLGACRMVAQQRVSVVMEIADKGRIAPGVANAGRDLRNGPGRFGRVHGHAHQLRARFDQFQGLRGCGANIGGGRIGHGLYRDRCAAADLQGSHANGDGVVSFIHRVLSVGQDLVSPLL